MKILFLQKKAHRAGAQVSLNLLVRSLRKQGVDASVLLGEDGWLAQELSKAEALRGIVPFPSFTSVTSRLFRLPVLKKRIAALDLAKDHFDIIHVNDTWDALCAEWLAGHLQLPWIVHVRNSSITPEHFHKYHCHKADAAIAVSPYVLNILKDEKDIHIEYIPNGLEACAFTVSAERPTTFPEKIAVIGSDAPVKGWFDMAAAFKIVADAGTRLPQEIHFYGPCEEASAKAVRDILPGTIIAIFHGRAEKLYDDVSRCDLVLIPSKRESFGRVLIETIAAGIPVLTSRTGIAPDILGENSPWMFLPEDPHDFACAWARLSTVWPQKQELLTAWQNKIRNEFMIDNCAKRVIAFYERVLCEFSHK